MAGARGAGPDVARAALGRRASEAGLHGLSALEARRRRTANVELKGIDERRVFTTLKAEILLIQEPQRMPAGSEHRLEGLPVLFAVNRETLGAVKGELKGVVTVFAADAVPEAERGRDLHVEGEVNQARLAIADWPAPQDHRAFKRSGRAHVPRRVRSAHEAGRDLPVLEPRPDAAAPPKGEAATGPITKARLVAADGAQADGHGHAADAGLAVGLIAVPGDCAAVDGHKRGTGPRDAALLGAKVQEVVTARAFISRGRDAFTARAVALTRGAEAVEAGTIDGRRALAHPRVARAPLLAEVWSLTRGPVSSGRYYAADVVAAGGVNARGGHRATVKARAWLAAAADADVAHRARRAVVTQRAIDALIGATGTRVAITDADTAGVIEVGAAALAVASGLARGHIWGWGRAVGGWGDARINVLCPIGHGRGHIADIGEFAVERSRPVHQAAVGLPGLDGVRLDGGAAIRIGQEHRAIGDRPTNQEVDDLFVLGPGGAADEHEPAADEHKRAADERERAADERSGHKISAKTWKYRHVRPRRLIMHEAGNITTGGNTAISRAPPRLDSCLARRMNPTDDLAMKNLAHALSLALTLNACGGAPPAVPSPEAQHPPALVGYVDRVGVLSALPAWQTAFEASSPDPAASRALLVVPPGARVDLVLGTWCSDSKREVTRFWKALEVAAPGGAPLPFQLRIIGVDRGKHAVVNGQDLTDGLDVKYVPTFIVTRGTEVGRVVESAPGGIEAALGALLRGEVR